MKKHLHWLHKEVDHWLQEGIIDETQAERIRGRYPTDEQAGSWGRIAFAAAGAVLIGLGVILLFAYNWEKMHKFAKLGVIFGALISVHGAGFFVKRPATRETLHVLGTMLFGSGIWLVAQIYHINEHYPNAFLVWGLGALSLAWVLPSLAQTLLATALLVLWNGFEVFSFHSPNFAAIAVIVLGVLPLAWVLRSRVAASAALLGFFFVLFTVLLRTHGHLAMPAFFAIAAVLIALGMILQRTDNAPELAPVCTSYGGLLYFIMLFILSFNLGQMASHYSRGQEPGAWFAIFLIVALGVWAAALWPFRDLGERIKEGLRIDLLAVPGALVLYCLQYYGVLTLNGVLATAPYNLLILFSAVALMHRGFTTLQVRSAAMGGTLLAALAFARYTDLFHSLLARAAVFLLVGGMMIGIGVFFARARKARNGGVE